LVVVGGGKEREKRREGRNAVYLGSADDAPTQRDDGVLRAQVVGKIIGEKKCVLQLHTSIQSLYRVTRHDGVTMGIEKSTR
jgi:hypothetical protein